MDDVIHGIRTKISTIGKLLFDCHLTDAAGGNISVRAGDYVCVTPRFSGSKYQWNISPDQVLVTTLQGEKLEGEGEISREAKVHYRIYKQFNDATAVVHCHAQNALVFACNSLPIEPVLEDTLKFGAIQVTRFAPAHSNRLAEYIVNQLAGQEERMRKQAAAVLVPWHCLFVAGKDLDAAFDAAQRIDTNARIIMFSRLLGGRLPIDASE